MEKVDVERLALADYMASRRAAILDARRNAIKRDPALSTGDSLPRVQLFDHSARAFALWRSIIACSCAVKDRRGSRRTAMRSRFAVLPKISFSMPSSTPGSAALP